MPIHEDTSIKFQKNKKRTQELAAYLILSGFSKVQYKLDTMYGFNHTDLNAQDGKHLIRLHHKSSSISIYTAGEIDGSTSSKQSSMYITESENIAYKGTVIDMVKKVMDIINENNNKGE